MVQAYSIPIERNYMYLRVKDEEYISSINTYPTLSNKIKFSFVKKSSYQLLFSTQLTKLLVRLSLGTHSFEKLIREYLPIC